MTLVLNAEQQMLRDSAMNFMREKAPVAQLRALRDRRDEVGFERELWQNFVDMGFTGVLIPEDYGGLGLGQAEAGIVMEAIGRQLACVPFFSTAVLGTTVLSRYGSEAQKQYHLPEIASGNRILALAIDEGGKHRPQRQALQAVHEEGGYRLDGCKTLVVDGHVADYLVVAARTSDEAQSSAGVTLFLVPGNAAGLNAERVNMVDAHNAARVVFSGVRVEADAVIGRVGQGWEILDAVLDIGRTALAAELLGIADEVFERTLGYVKERKQFGKTIGEFQALQHRASQLYTEIEITRSLVMESQRLLDKLSLRAAAIASAAKARAGLTAALAVQEGVQMHGGIGMTDEFEIGFFMKRQRVLQELLGDANFHIDRWARLARY